MGVDERTGGLGHPFCSGAGTRSPWRSSGPSGSIWCVGRALLPVQISVGQRCPTDNLKTDSITREETEMMTTMHLNVIDKSPRLVSENNKEFCAGMMMEKVMVWEVFGWNRCGRLHLRSRHTPCSKVNVSGP